MIRILLFLSSVFLVASCATTNNAEEGEVPEEMQICFDYIEALLSKQEMDEFRTSSEDELIKYHRGLGLNLRNNLLRHHEHSEKIQEYFHDQEIFHFDDMSSLIIKSYHRYLNEKGSNVQDEVERYHDYWEPIEACEAKLKITALQLNERYQEGDVLRIQMLVSESNSVFDYPCPDDNRDWEFNDSTDLEITGVISKKYYNNDPTNLFFSLLVLSKSRADTKILMEEVKLGDHLEMSLKTAWKIVPND